MSNFSSVATSVRGYITRKAHGLMQRWETYKTNRLLQQLRRQIQTGITENKRVSHCRQLRQEECIPVIFLIDTFSKWKADSLLRLLIKHPRFQPAIRLVDYYGDDPRSYRLNQKLIQEYADSLGVPCLRIESYNQLPQKSKTHLIILNEAYDEIHFWRAGNQGLTKHLLCYIPYGFFSIGCAATMNNVINNIALFNFYENEATLKLAESLMDNKGSNVCITGHTMADAFLFSPDKDIPAWKNCGKPMKRIIWAPHWTITEGNAWFACGNFLELAPQVLALAEQYRDKIQFAFKPHPRLHEALCHHPDWGKEKTDAFYRRWAEMPNTQLEEGAYAALFMQSDAIFHDSSSFIIEYMFADKPALYLVRGEGYQGFSPMARAALDCYTKGNSASDIESFLQAVLQGEDPLRNQRAAFRNRYLIPPHGQSAAQNVVDCLLGEGAYAESMT